MKNYFSSNLKLIRESNRLSQSELSKKLGLKRAAISTYEREKNIPKIETLLKIRKLFNISIDDMICVELKVELNFKTKTKW